MIVPPLIVRSDEGLTLFASGLALRAYVEVPDLEDGVYGPAFDAEGRLLAIELPGELHEPRADSGLRRLLRPVTRQFKLVEPKVLDAEPAHRHELRAMPLDVLDPPDTAAALDELVRLASDRLGVIGT